MYQQEIFVLLKAYFPRNFMDTISIDDVKKVEIRIGEIRSASAVEGSEKLLKLSVSFGFKKVDVSKEETVEGKLHVVEGSTEVEPEEEIRQVVSGIAKHFPDLSTLVGKRCAFVTNLQYRKMMGLESQAMILATGGDSLVEHPGEFEPLHLFESTAPLGSLAR